MVQTANLGHHSDFRLGSVTVRPSRCDVVGQRGTVRLEPRMMQVLIELVEAKGDTLTRDDLIERCWDSRIVSDNVISRIIFHLRKIPKTIGDDSFSIITIPKIGYRLAFDESSAPAAPSSPDGVSTLAVLPFRNLSDGHDYFAEGVAEEIRSQLSRHAAFRVAGQTSSQIAAQLPDAKEIGRRLQVAHLLEGSVRKAEHRVRVDVALVSTANGHRVWADTFEGTLDDIFGIQDRIGATIASRLRTRLTDAAPPGDAVSVDGSAYELFVVAKTLLRFRTPDKIATAIGLLEGAIAKDAHFAPAWARLGVALGMKAMFQTDAAAIAEVRRDALDRVKHALSLAPESPEVRAAYGALLYQDDIEAAGRELERAAALGEDTSELWFWLCAIHDRTGNYTRSIAAARRTVQLDPLWYGTVFAALTVLDAGLEDEARRWLAGFLSAGDGASDMVAAYLAMFRNDYARAVLLARQGQASLDAPLRPLASATLARSLLGLGYVAEARAADPSIVTAREAELRQGRLPPDLLDKPFGGDRRNLRVNPERYFGLRRLVKGGRADDVVAYYRLTAGSPAGLRAHPDGHLAFLADAAIMSKALHATGHASESRDLSELARAEMEEREAAGMVPRSYALNRAQLCACLGDRNGVYEALSQVRQTGVSPFHPASLTDICEDPVFDAFRSEGAFREIEADFVSRVASQRTQLTAAG